MITHLPADLELGFAYRQLVSLLGGEVGASFVVQKLWCHLAFQTSVHGKAGVYEHAYLPHLRQAIKPAGEPDLLIEALLASGFCSRCGNGRGDLFCPTFNHYNAHLDSTWIPPSMLWLKEWHNLQFGLRSLKFRVDDVPKHAWTLPDQTLIPKDEMRRAVMIVRTLDIILRYRVAGHRGQVSYKPMDELAYLPRKASELTVGVIQAAVRVLRQHGDLKLGVILQRFMAVCRPRIHPLFPPTTEECLENFDALMILADAPGGLEAWLKRVEGQRQNPELYEAETRDETIKDELNRVTVKIQAEAAETSVGGISGGGDAVAGAACPETDAVVQWPDAG